MTRCEDSWVREAVFGGATWQWVGKPSDNFVFLQTGYKVDGKWVHLPAVELLPSPGEDLHDRFNRFVDRFLADAKASNE